MDNKKNNPREANKGKRQKEGACTRDSKERSQDFSNEQNPLVENGAQNRERIDKSTGNLADQYHPATESGKNQDKQSMENTKKAQQGDDYYDQGAPQPDAGDIKKRDESISDKIDKDRWDRPGQNPRKDPNYNPKKDPNLNPQM
ncbi:MAG: hypothetical protein R3213_07935 [Flavobacteriaceae bacterium]|nr:hypothetical protein [Flavobacteriaceae bacterium]